VIIHQDIRKVHYPTYAFKYVLKCVRFGAARLITVQAMEYVVHQEVPQANVALKAIHCVLAMDAALINTRSRVVLTVAQKTVFAAMGKTAARTKKHAAGNNNAATKKRLAARLAKRKLAAVKIKWLAVMVDMDVSFLANPSLMQLVAS
jgi:hypothetical protein